MRNLCSIVLAAMLGLPVQAQTLEVAAGVLGPGANSRESVEILPDIGSSSNLPTPALREARKKMIAKEPIPLLVMRDLADLGDSLAAYRFADAIAAWENPALTADVAHYYGRAAAAGRSGAIFGFIDHLEILDPATTTEARLRILREVLIAYAEAGDPRAVQATLQFHLSGVPFGPMDDVIAGIVEAGADEDVTAEGADALALQLATEILQGTPDDVASLTKARGFLDIAMRSKSVSVLAIAQHLSGSVDLQLASLTSTTGEVQ